MNKYIILMFTTIFIILLFLTSDHLYPGDSGEFTVAAKLLSIGHPSGFSFYIIIGKLFNELLFFLDPLKIMSIASLFYLILSILFSFIFMRKISENTFLSISLCLTIISIPSIWIYGFIPEVYTLNLLFLSICILLSIDIILDKKHTDLLLFISCLAVSIHITFIFFIPIFWFIVFKYGKLNFKKFIIILIGFSVFLYLPLRSSSEPIINWAEPNTPLKMLSLISGSEKNVGSQLFKLSFSSLILQLKDFINICFKYYNIFFFMSFLGIFYFLKKNKFLFFLFSSSFSFLFIFLINISHLPSERLHFYIPCFYIIHILIFSSFLFFKNKKHIFYILIIIFLTINFHNFYINFNFFNAEIENYYLTLVKDINKNSILFIEGDELTFCDWYFRFIKEKKDLPIVISRSALPAIWYRNYCKKNFKILANISFKNDIDIIEKLYNKHKIYYDLKESQTIPILKNKNINFFKFELIPFKGKFKLSNLKKPNYDLKIPKKFNYNIIKKRYIHFYNNSILYAVSKNNFNIAYKLNEKLTELSYEKSFFISSYIKTKEKKYLKIVNDIKKLDSRSNSIEKIIKLSSNYYKINDLNNYLKIAEQGILLYPKNNDIIINYAQSQYENGNFNLALKQTDKIKKNNNIHYLRGLIFYGLKKFSACSTELKEFIKYNKKNANAYIILGQCYAKLNLNEKNIYLNGLAQNPFNLELNLKLADTYYKEKNYERSLNIIDKVLKIDPNSIGAKNILKKIKGYSIINN